MSTPIIALTASAFDEDKKKAKLFGLQGFIRKPFRESELFGEIGRTLGITYKYETDNTAVSDIGAAETDEMAIENLKKLPVNMLDNMLDAITKADMDFLIEIINDINPDYSDLIKYLKYLAGNYDYNKIQFLIQKAEYKKKD
jgi:CheY-like chemotaxis protein